MKDMVTYDDFAKLEIRIAKIVKAEEIEGADKLLKLTLDVGDPSTGSGLGRRTVAAGIKAWYKPEELEGKLVPYLANLEPRNLRGVESQGMILAAGGEEAVLLHPAKDIEPGTQVR